MGFLNQIQGGRWDEELRRLFSMKQGAVSPTVAAELVAAIILEDDRPENFALAGVRICSAPFDRPAVASQFTMCQIFNPAGSGVLGIVTSVRTGSSNDGDLIGFIGTTALSTLHNNEVKLDTRLIDPAVGATFRPTLKGRVETAVGSVAGTAFAQIRSVGAVAPELVAHAVMLRPGFGLFTRPEAVNRLNKTTMYWYERPLNPSEEFETG